MECNLGLINMPCWWWTRGKIVNSDGVELPNEKVIKLIEEGESYKYLDVLDADELMVNEMKDKFKKEY